MYVHSHELNELDSCEVLLPPNVTRVGAHKVVRVHNSTHEAIKHTNHRPGRHRMSRSDEEYRKVVVHVQDGELFSCLAKDNEDRVTKIEHHWQIEEIQHIAHDGGIGFEDIA